MHRYDFQSGRNALSIGLVSGTCEDHGPRQDAGVRRNALSIGLVTGT
jgi:hypothetical protein